MDSVTQIALGAAVGGAVMGRRAGWRAFAIGGLVGTLPDLDSFIPMGNPVADFTYHRGYTHALFVQTLAAPAIAWPIQRLRRASGESYGRWLLTVWLILITHALLDAFTIYGTQLFLPFTDYPVGLGSIFIIDPLYTLPLIVGAFAAIWLGRRGAWRSGARWNAAGLVLSSLYLAWTAGAQQWMELRAGEALAAQGIPAERMLATPTPFNSLLWRVVAVGSDAHWEGFLTVGDDREPDFHRYPHDPELLSGIEDTWAVQRLQAFTKGFYAVEERGDQIVITDLRMGQAGFYAFAFRVGKRNGVGVEPISSARFQYPRPELGIVFSELIACGRGRPTEMIAC
ncbi:metal-dependent hydrolase [Ectothiorhodospiraceae bacterium WFHF3C12]|nr:metal-dependent hydrolase [Ectothiorhodospiraceae bacterium WFHF3C12]